MYEGEYFEDQIHGKGHQIWLSDGSEYIGDYVQGLREGQGRFKYANGDTYEGGWMENFMHGQGKYVWASKGRETEGKWHIGKRVGEHMYTHPEGREKHFYGNDGKLTRKVILMPSY